LLAMCHPAASADLYRSLISALLATQAKEDDVGKTDHQLERAHGTDFQTGSPVLLALDTFRLVEPLSRVADPQTLRISCEAELNLGAAPAVEASVAKKVSHAYSQISRMPIVKLIASVLLRLTICARSPRREADAALR
jgi:hypothetical protein